MDTNTRVWQWRNCPMSAQRLDCGGFSAAMARTETGRWFENIPPAQSAAEVGAVQTLRAVG